MHRFCFSLFLICLSVSSSGQIIMGTVVERETRHPVSYAAVYFDGTSVASYTDEKGSFRLDIKGNSSKPLTISALGYYSTSIVDFSPGKDILVYLEPKIFEMKDVSIRARRNPLIRRENMAIFRREFLGRTGNAKLCEILNEDDVRFVTSGNGDTLRAYALKPVYVLNRALGYKITYYLNKFEYVKSAYLNQIIGNSIFDEDTISGFGKDAVENRRNSTYYGSRMHFIRTLWQDDLKAEGFVIKDNKRLLSNQDLVRNQLSVNAGQPVKNIYYPFILPALLSVKWEPGKALSGMEILRNNIFFDRTGYYRGPGIIWHGEMAKEGLADLLPYDYQPSVDAGYKAMKDYRKIDSLVSDEFDYHIADLTEKVYLHTDRDIYNPGDILWFKAYVIDGITHMPSDSSAVLHIELISPGSAIVGRKTVRLENGMGYGEFILPDHDRSDKYRLRSYTNYMRNFGDQLFFNKEINVISGSDTGRVHTSFSDLAGDSLDISFLPEGGSLVENVPAVVAFKAVDPSGYGIDVTGEIRSGDGKLITTFKSTHRGMGKFLLNPVHGYSYYAVVKTSDGAMIRKDLPRIFSKGFVLSARQNSMNEYVVTIKTNHETLPRYLNRDLLIAISSHKKNIMALFINIDSLRNTFTLPSWEFPDGILMITLFDLDNKPLSERLIFVRNKDGIEVSVEPDKKTYNQRDSVLVGLTVTDNFNTGEEVYLSFSAAENLYFDSESQFPSSISSWFLIESDIHGPVEEPSSYFDPSDPDRLRNLDLLLLTHGWRDFEWKYRELKFLPETGFTISGRLRRSLMDSPLANKPVSIGIFQGEKNIVTNVFTDSLGRFRIDLDNLSGSAKVIVTASDKRGRQGRILLDSSYLKPAEIENYSSMKGYRKEKRQLNEEHLSLLKESDQIIKSIRKKYTLSDTILIDEVQIFAKRKETPQAFHISQVRIIAGEPDKEIIITPELESQSISDILIGNVAGLTLSRSDRSSSGIRIRGMTSLEGSHEPLFLLDGIISSYEEVNSIPKNWIDRIDVIKSEKAAAYGVRGAFGVVSVITRTSKDITYEPVSWSAGTEISGYDSPRIFYSPDYSLKQRAGYATDHRSTLYWYPDIKALTNQDYLLKYFNADVSSIYRISVEGITSSGIPVTGKATYEVK